MKIIVPVVAVVLLAACSQPTEPQEPPVPQAAASAGPAAGTPLEPLFEAREKARGVEQTVLDAAAKQRKAIDEATGG